MYIILTGCAQQGASDPLALTITQMNPVDIIGASSQTLSSNSGDIASTATATGGAGGYTYSWVLSELRDDFNNFSINTQGTTTTSATHDTAIIDGITPASPFDPPNDSEYQLQCTVTDSNGDTASAVTAFNVNAIAI